MTEAESICFHKSFGDSLETGVECLSQSDVMEFFFETLEKRLSLLDLKYLKTSITSFVLELMRKKFKKFFLVTVATHNLTDNLN